MNDCVHKPKLPWKDLVPMGYRKCDDCGQIAHTCKRKPTNRKNICEKCYSRKRV